MPAVTASVTLRIPGPLLERVDELARADGVSRNAWLVLAVELRLAEARFGPGAGHEISHGKPKRSFGGNSTRRARTYEESRRADFEELGVEDPEAPAPAEQPERIVKVDEVLTEQLQQFSTSVRSPVQKLAEEIERNNEVAAGLEPIVKNALEGGNAIEGLSPREQAEARRAMWQSAGRKPK